MTAALKEKVPTIKSQCDQTLDMKARVVSSQNLEYGRLYTVLYCNVLYSTVLYCTVLYRTIMYPTVPYDRCA